VGEKVHLYTCTSSGYSVYEIFFSAGICEIVACLQARANAFIAGDKHVHRWRQTRSSPEINVFTLSLTSSVHVD